jgi:hypothetical protein
VNEILSRVGDSLGRIAGFLPALLGAGVIFFAGYFLARALERWVDAWLSRMDFNRMAEAGGLREAVDRTGARLDPVHAVGKLAFWLVMLLVIMLASAALGLESINQMFGIMISFIPSLITAIVVILLGMVIGEFLRGLILASAGSVEGVPVLARVTKGAVVLIAIFMALEQVGVAQEIVVSGFTLILGALALAFGLAFGLGNATLAGEVVRRWYERREHPEPPHQTPESED